MRRLLIVLALAASSCAVNPQIRIVNRGETAIAFAEIAAGGVRLEFTNVAPSEAQTQYFSPVEDSSVIVKFRTSDEGRGHECIGVVYVTNGPSALLTTVEILPDLTCRFSVEPN